MSRNYFLKICFAAVLFLMAIDLEAQYENDIWFFGSGSAGMIYSHTQNKFLQFSTHQPLGGEGCAVATDPVSGDMMFYTDGKTVYTRNHIVMQNGNDLGGNSSSAQAVAIVPVPGDCNQYYVFSNGKGGSGADGDLYYCTIDMTANSGEGKVINPKTLLRQNIAEGMISIPKPSSPNFWLVGSDNNAGSTFYVFEITISGITPTPALFNTSTGDYRYCLSYSEKAGKIAASYPGGRVYSFEFDAFTGILSNELLLDNDFVSAYSSVWSPDGTKLYYSTWTDGTDIRQYDFNNVSNPITSILESDTVQGGGLKLGPDGKIYFIADLSSSFLSCINYPDNPGLTCNYQPNFIDLGVKISGLNLPATLTPIWKPEGCQSPAWKAWVSSNNNYSEPPEVLRDVVKNGIAYIPPALSANPYYWTQFQAKLPQSVVVSGAVSLECRVKNSLVKGGIDAFDVGIWMTDGSKSSRVYFMGNPSAVSFANIAFGEQIQDNLNELVTNFEDWRILRLEVQPGFLRAYIDGKLKYTFPYNGTLCKLSGFGISFKGSGELDYINLYDGTGSLTYHEDFDSPCEFACVTANPSEEEYINRYAAVEEICSNRLMVSNPENFSPDDKVLLIQMQGAIADESTDLNTCGQVLSYGNAGNYEINEVKKIIGNYVYLKHKIKREYDIPGKVQLVNVPELGNKVIGCISCPAWNGQTGGILAFTGGDITIEGDIDVSAKGFPGGRYYNEPNESYDFFGLYLPDNHPVNLAGFKGDGIKIIPPEIARARAPQANSGGGGLEHNCGGAGGSNCSPGGNGGVYYNQLQSINFEGGGIGGRPLLYNNALNKVFMGGGGGAGHSNNGKGSRGGNGGGLIIGIVKSITYKGGAIRANGEQAPRHQSWPNNNDGGSGGGGGGTILLDITGTVSSEVLFEAKGGDGSSVQYVHGHGGGGGGGLVWVDQWQGGNAVLTGGSPGIGTDGKNNRAEPGSNGLVLTGVDIPRGGEFYEDIQIVGTTTTPDCKGKTKLTLNISGGKLPLRYSYNNGSTWQNDNTFDSLPGGIFHIIVADACDEVLDTVININAYLPLQSAFSYLKDRHCDSLGVIEIDVWNGKEPYQFWLDTTPWNGRFFDELHEGFYTINIRDGLGCLSTLSTEIHSLSETIMVQTSPDTTIIHGASIPLTGLVSSEHSSTYIYQWRSSPGLIDLTQLDITAKPEVSTSYTLVVTDEFGCPGSSTTKVTVIAPRVYIPNIFCPGCTDENRKFTVMGAEGVSQIQEMSIFDKWGGKVFELHNFQPGDISTAWNGDCRGQKSPAGVYAYYVILSYIDGSREIINGDVTLIR